MSNPEKVQAMKIWQLPEDKKDQFSDLCKSNEYFAQEKIDGALYIYEKTEERSYLFSRTVSAKDGELVEKSANVPHIISALDSVFPAGTIVVGEIYYPNKSSKDVVSIMGALPDKAIERQQNNPIHYYMHDMIKFGNLDMKLCPAYLRYKCLHNLWKANDRSAFSFLHLADYIEENIEEYTNKILAQGGEGVVLKRKDSIYDPGKRPAWQTIKIKKHGDDDVICIGFEPPTKYYNGKLDLIANYGGKDADKWQYWCIEHMDLSNGVILGEKKVPVGQQKVIRGMGWRTIPVTKAYYYNWYSAIEIGAINDEGAIKSLGTVSSGLDDELKEDMRANPDRYLNKVVKITYMEKDIKEQTFRHPVFMEFRDDKTKEECKIEDIFR